MATITQPTYITGDTVPQKDDHDLHISRTSFKTPSSLLTYRCLTPLTLQHLLGQRDINHNKPLTDSTSELLCKDDEGTLHLYFMTNTRLRNIALRQNLMIDQAMAGRAEERGALLSALRHAQAAAKAKRFNLLGLPAELRNRVYHLAAVNEKQSLSLPAFPALLHVSRQVRAEAAGIFFGCNTFCLEMEAEFYFDKAPNLAPHRKEYPRHTWIMQATQEWLIRVEEQHISQIRSLMVTVRIPPLYQTSYCHAISISFDRNVSSCTLSYHGRLLYREGYYTRWTNPLGVYQLHPDVIRQLAEVVSGGANGGITKDRLRKLMAAFGAWDDPKSDVSVARGLAFRQ